ncbi:hypothetical protein B0H13DRAFT_2108436 [Mycena leptocephala]|nr:hypothetical protein B0H13DRAFT_2108436 [Mycena leptocephala]
MPLPAHTTLLIAVVAGSVGGVLVLFLLFRLLRRPAKQELARYREQQTHHVAESRPPTWYDSGFLSAPSGTFTGSKSSLLPPDSRGGSPFRRPSLNTSESPSEDISHLSGSVPMAPELQLPHLSFDTSSTSLSTAETDSPASWSPPLASLSDSSFSPTSRYSRPTSTSSRPNRRPRPLSVGSNGSSAVSRQTRNTIRGVPHGPHNQMQIVLPAPLAFNDRMSIHENSPRLSVVDQWAPAAVRAEGNPIPKPQRRSLSSSEPRRSTSQSSLAQPPITAPQPRRAASASASASSPAHHNRDYSNPSSRFLPPPVPQIPQQWLPPSGDPLMGIPEDGARGRSREPVVTNERAPQAVDRPPAPEGRRLQRRSRSRV